jgi:hypothetical protein
LSARLRRLTTGPRFYHGDDLSRRRLS